MEVSIFNGQEINERFVSNLIPTEKPPGVLYNIGVGPKTEAKTLKRVYPELEVFGCEPLLAHAADGVFDDFPGMLLPIGLSQYGGTKIIHRDWDNIGSSSMLQLKTHTESIEVPTKTLEEFDGICGKPKRILLWMDIEGMELEVLKGGASVLASHRVRWINLEEQTSDSTKSGWPLPAEIQRYLLDFGFVKIAEYNKHIGHQDVVYINKGEFNNV